MAEVKTEQEPSIEEILESIRQIISEDTEEGKEPEPEVKLELPKEAAVPPSSLSLKPEPAPPVPPPAPKVEAKPVEKVAVAPLDLTEKVAAPPLSIESEPMQAPITIEMMDSPMTDKDKASSLMSPETATAVTESLSKLLASNVAIEEETSRPGKVTLEEIARDLMKPLIKIWLDQNLPGIIEKAVQKEVEKLSRRAMDR